MDRDRWLVERGRIPGIGASQSAALFNLHPYESSFSLFEKMTNPKDMTDEEIEEMSDVQEFGLAVEPALASWYSRRTGRAVIEPEDPGVYRLSKERPYVFASPDRLIVAEGCAIKTNAVLQLKSGIHFDPTAPIPDSWAIQEQHEMLVTGMKSASFAIWATFRKRYYINDIPRNDAFCEILVETIDRFMHAVQLGSWGAWGGDIEGSKATREALHRLYPQDKGTVVQLPAEASSGILEIPGTKERRAYVGWADRRDKVKRAIKTLEAIESDLDNKLRAAIGEHSYGVLQDGSAFSLKVTKGSTYTVTKEDYRTLRRVKALPKGLTA